jgi:hypothetical protein
VARAEDEEARLRAIRLLRRAEEAHSRQRLVEADAALEALRVETLRSARDAAAARARLEAASGPRPAPSASASSLARGAAFRERLRGELSSLQARSSELREAAARASRQRESARSEAADAIRRRQAAEGEARDRRLRAARDRQRRDEIAAADALSRARPRR